MVEKKVTEKKVAAKTTAKRTTRKSTAKKAAETVAINAENVGFRAGDVYQTLSVAEKALSVDEIAKAAKISKEEVLLGMGWLLKEGKIKDENNKFVLA